ncbi:hypothetical protein VHEMI09096 [[Torrubiella] hemipterigena]|uniref:Uncharacterized protein n=1 Tax=[Torrubiella] hemipterigena TaxID=1531966 RepID=A0A0A1TFF1_9HYPO|nr:hypothetical protein VHEMI09096 [[Torrubiella] hemipterigena]
MLDEHGILDIDLEDDVKEIVPLLRGTLTAQASPPSSGESVDTPQSTDGADVVDLGGDTYLSPNIDRDLSRSVSRRRRSSQASSVSAVDRRIAPFEPAVGVSSTMANAYRRLLVRVVENSRHARLPLFNSTTDEEPSTYNDPFNLRLYQKVEQDQRVGAAGELWVYELLSRLDPSLPGFFLSNWCSTIRGYVSSHPDYSDLESCDGPEPSDIVCKDDSGVFTNMLVEHGYMEASVLDEPPIQYYIEVKTTTTKCNTAFYMSNSQYNKVWILFKVYSITF